MTYLLDTCTLLWAAQDADALSAEALRIIADSSTLVVSPISVAEISIKVARGRLTLLEPLEQLLESLRQELEFDYVPLVTAASLRLLTLPSIHRDPFDRLLICQSLEHQLTILTPDQLIRQYAVPTLW